MAAGEGGLLGSARGQGGLCAASLVIHLRFQPRASLTQRPMPLAVHLGQGYWLSESAEPAWYGL